MTSSSTSSSPSSSSFSSSSPNDGNDGGPFDGCTEIFVGGGWAGIYSLYRRVTSYPNLADTMCLMEASWRIGGRTYSVPINHTAVPFVQDVGAYRFSPDMHLVGDLILNELDLPTECYQTDCPSAKEDFPEPFMFNYSAPLRRIVNPDTGLPSGYATALHTMVDRVTTLGARVFTQMKLTNFSLTDEVGGGNVHLVFEDTVTGQAISLPSSSSSSSSDDTITALFLNLPRNKLLDVNGVAESLPSQSLKTIQCIVFDAPADLFGDETAAEFHDIARYTTNLGKAYLFYPNAWWRTLLHQTEGKWPTNVGFAAVITPSGVRFNIRWHDGPVACTTTTTGTDTTDTPTGGIGSCQGLLETYYSVSNETFYSSLPTSPDEPLGSIWDTDGPEAKAILLEAHNALLDILGPLITEQRRTNNVTATTTATNTVEDINSIFTPPTGLIVGVWHRPTMDHPYGRGYTAPTKVYYYPTESGTPDVACGVEGLTDDTYRDTVLRPWSGTHPNIFLMNNDYSCLDVRYLWGDWAEETLLQAERAVTMLGTPKASWVDMDYYQINIIQKLPGTLDGATATTATATTGGSYDAGTSWMMKLILLPLAVVALMLVVWKIISKSRSSKYRQGDYTVIP